MGGDAVKVLDDCHILIREFQEQLEPDFSLLRQELHDNDPPVDNCLREKIQKWKLESYQYRERIKNMRVNILYIKSQIECSNHMFNQLSSVEREMGMCYMYIIGFISELEEINLKNYY
jgi:hypothetical protein